MRAEPKAVLFAFLCVAIAAPARAAVPAEPTTVRKSRISDTQVVVTWRDKSVNEDGFEILRRAIDEPEFEVRGTVNANVTTFTDNDTPKGTIFIFRVRSFNEDGNSDLSNECYVNRPSPPVPNYFNARLIALTVVRVGWLDRANGERGFEIQRAPLNGKFKTIAIVEPNTETWDDTGLDPTFTYTYRMRTLGRPGICWGNSKYTVERTVTTKGSVRILQVELRGRGDGTVTSDPPGISCGPDDDHCAAEFNLETNVTLEADPAHNSHFTGWEDIPRCDDTLGPCEVYMSKDKIIGAEFKRNN